jgi:hypothetical protein
MKYKAYLKQSCEGCDYTIGCARTVVHIDDAVNMEDAKQKLTTIILEEYGSDEKTINSAELYEINEIFVMPVDEIYAKHDELRAQREQQKKEDAEREEFERLKQKFGQ